MYVAYAQEEAEAYNSITIMEKKSAVARQRKSLIIILVAFIFQFEKGAALFPDV